jgi:hypothetical protein
MSLSDSQRRWLTPPQAGRRYGVKPERIIELIRSGEIRAIDIARRGSKRPRYRICECDLIAFENARAVSPPPKAARRRRRPAEVIAFF